MIEQYNVIIPSFLKYSKSLKKGKEMKSMKTYILGERRNGINCTFRSHGWSMIEDDDGEKSPKREIGE